VNNSLQGTGAMRLAGMTPELTYKVYQILTDFNRFFSPSRYFFAGGATQGGVVLPVAPGKSGYRYAFLLCLIIS